MFLVLSISKTATLILLWALSRRRRSQEAVNLCVRDRLAHIFILLVYFKVETHDVLFKWPKILLSDSVMAQHSVSGVGRYRCD